MGVGEGSSVGQMPEAVGLRCHLGECYPAGEDLGLIAWRYFGVRRGYLIWQRSQLP